MQDFLYRMQILEEHLDSFGHVNNAKYLEMYEKARWEMITLGGYSYKKVQELQKGPVVLEAHVKFRKELVLREWVTIDFNIGVVEGKKLQKGSQNIIKDNGEIASTAEFVFGFFDLKERKLIEPTLEWKQALGLN
ncbi:acyl-CoA thioesterase [Bacteriovoracaceae bacterium]|nr:acyl-CoA thioesterase [Bacteriovoracaceae bacterium]